MNDLECLTNNASAHVEENRGSYAAPCIREKYAFARKKFLGLFGEDPDATVNAKGQSVVLVSKDTNCGFLMWLQESGTESLHDVIHKRTGCAREKIKALGPTIGLLDGFIPQIGHESPEAYEQRVNACIEAVESGFSGFHRLLCSNIDCVSPHLRTRIMAPHRLIELNKNNPWKNIVTVVREHKNQSRTQPSVEMFTYDVKTHSNAKASFGGKSRMMSLPPSLKGENLFDMALVHHELVHADQDFADRKNLKEAEYNSFHAPGANEKTNVVFADECAAYALEFEALNAILRGVLDNTSLDLDTAVKAFNISEEQKEFCRDTLELAALYYFREGRWQVSGMFPPSLARTIYKMYSKTHNFFVIDQQGKRSYVEKWEAMPRNTVQYTSDGMPIQLPSSV